MTTRHPGAIELLKQNADWASKQDSRKLKVIAAEKQTPKVAWFGCADSRVPESVITRSGLGHIFVHRNIANQFHLNDLSAKSVLFYAIDHLKVDHIIIVGHTKCGGVIAALNAKKTPLEPPLNEWLGNLANLGKKHTSEQSLVEANVRIQVTNVLKLLKAHKLKKALKVRGWLYQMENGRIRELELHEITPRV